MMTLRPDDGSPATRRLIELRARLRNLEIDQLDTLSVEEDIRAALDDVGRELMAEVFAKADIDDQEVYINQVLHGRVDRHTATIHTSFGAVRVARTTYRHDRHTSPVSPFDKLIGIVEGFYTPKCAKILCLLPALMPN